MILSRPALPDLGEIARYIAEDKASSAERVGLELVSLAESLATWPRSGGVMCTRPGTWRLVQAPYLVTYRIDEVQQIVYGLRFWPTKRDPQSWRAE